MVLVLVLSAQATSAPWPAETTGQATQGDLPIHKGETPGAVEGQANNSSVTSPAPIASAMPHGNKEEHPVDTGQPIDFTYIATRLFELAVIIAALASSLAVLSVIKR